MSYFFPVESTAMGQVYSGTSPLKREGNIGPKSAIRTLLGRHVNPVVGTDRHGRVEFPQKKQFTVTEVSQFVMKT